LELIRLAQGGELTRERFRELVGPDPFDPRNFNVDSPCPPRSFVHSYVMRDKYIRAVSFGVYTSGYLDSLKRLLQGQRVLEVCSGRGVLQGLMQERGINWTSTDIDPWEPGTAIKMDALRAVEVYAPDVIYASWVDLGSDLDQELAHLKPCVFLAESCTGTYESDAWWNPKDFRVIKTPDGFEDVPCWMGIRDGTVLTVPLDQESPFPNRLRSSESGVVETKGVCL